MCVCVCVGVCVCVCDSDSDSDSDNGVVYSIPKKCMFREKIVIDRLISR